MCPATLRLGATLLKPAQQCTHLQQLDISPKHRHLPLRLPLLHRLERISALPHSTQPTSPTRGGHHQRNTFTIESSSTSRAPFKFSQCSAIPDSTQPQPTAFLLLLLLLLRYQRIAVTIAPSSLSADYSTNPSGTTRLRLCPIAAAKATGGSGPVTTAATPQGSSAYYATLGALFSRA